MGGIGNTRNLSITILRKSNFQCCVVVALPCMVYTTELRTRETMYANDTTFICMQDASIATTLIILYVMSVHD